VEGKFSGVKVVVVWIIANLVLAAVLVGFAAGKSGHLLDIVLYFASMALVVVVALLLWLVRRRRPLARGLHLPARPAAVVLLTVGVALAWLGLAFGAWFPLIAAVPLAAALMLEVSARRSAGG
jgi:hypothetical protein